MLFIFLLSTAVYAIILLLIIYALWRSKVPHQQELKSISVIIAARNEEHNLPNLLASLSALDYPADLYEIIIVNDHSIDATLPLLRSWEGKHNIRVIDWQGRVEGLMGKKAALQQGIEAARYDIMAFTDADCILPKTWLAAINKSFDEDTDYVLGYSILKRHLNDRDLRLKNFERSIYYALAATGFYYKKAITSSACNMAYRKSLFIRAGGFGPMGALPSGDDDLLLMRMMPYIRKAVFQTSREIQVISIDGDDSRKRHNTNIRRASKVRYYPIWLKLTSGYVFAYFTLFYGILGSAITGYGGLQLWYMLSIKTALEVSLVTLNLHKLRRKKLLLLYPLQLVIYPAYFVYYAIRGTLGKYIWK